MLAMLRNDSYIHHTELKKEGETKKKEKKKNEQQRFTILDRLCLVARSFFFFFTYIFLVPDCPNVMYNKYPVVC